MNTSIPTISAPATPPSQKSGSSSDIQKIELPTAQKSATIPENPVAPPDNSVSNSRTLASIIKNLKTQDFKLNTMDVMIHIPPYAG